MSDVEQYFTELQGTVFEDEVWGNATCTETGMPDVWFEFDRYRNKDEIYLLKGALETCNSCHLRSECLQKGMQGEDIYWGIWGGLFPAERQALMGRANLTIVQRGLLAARSLRRKTGVELPQ